MLTKFLKSWLARLLGASGATPTAGIEYFDPFRVPRPDNSASYNPERRGRELAASTREQSRPVPITVELVRYLTPEQVLVLKRAIREEKVYIACYIAWKAYLKVEELSPGGMPPPRDKRDHLDSEHISFTNRVTRPLRAVHKDTLAEAIQKELDLLHEEYLKTGRVGGLVYDENMSPRDYEHFCAGILKENGWDATATKASGDQGGDVTARKDNVVAVIQTKKYKLNRHEFSRHSRAAGNTAFHIRPATSHC